MANFVFEVKKEWNEYRFGGGFCRCEKSATVVGKNVAEAIEKSGFGAVGEYDVDGAGLYWMTWYLSKPDTRERDNEGMLSGTEGESWLEVTMLGVMV